MDVAMQKAHGLGVASTPYEELSNEHFNDGQQYNFGVFWYSKQNRSTKCILHIDTGCSVVSLLHRGQELKKFTFSNLSHIDSTDDTSRLIIALHDMSTYEVDLSSLEDKNRVTRIFLSILDQDQVTDIEQNLRNDSFKERRQTILKEGILEKKGRSAAFLIWPRRYVKLMQGEIMYFKVGDERDENSALSILRLNQNATSIKKSDNNAFILNVNKKEYVFRISTNTKETEKERDDWVLAIKTAMNSPHTGQTKDMSVAITDQESYLKSVVRSLNEELEQLDSVLSVIDAPIRASTQVKRVREIVHSLNDQIHSGLLSWTLRNAVEQEENMKNHTGKINTNKITHTDKNNIEKKKITPNYYHLHNRPSKQSDGSYNSLNFVHEEGQDGNAYHMRTNISPTNFNEYVPVDENVNVNTATFVNDDYEPIENLKTTVNEKVASDLNNSINLPEINTENNKTTQKPTITEYAPLNKVVKKPEVYVNINSDHFAKSNIIPDLPPPLHENSIGDSVTSENEHLKSFVVNKDESENEITKQDNQENTNLIAQNLKKQEQVEILDQNTSNLPGNNIPLPPPLPGNFVVQLPSRNFIESKCKLKPFFWSKVPELSINNSIWKTAVDRSEEINLELLESLFYLGQEKSKSISNELDKIGLENEKAKTVKSILNPKKAQNLGIFLNGFKLSVSDIDSKLNTVSSGLSIDEIIALKRFQPTTEEIELFRSINVNDITVDTDIFMHKLCSIEHLNERLDILLTLNEVPEEYENINVTMHNIHKMLIFLLESKDLFRFWEYILSMGNYLNSGSNRGQAYGFKLSSLTKLSDILSYNKTVSLLDFIVDELYKNDKSAVLCCRDINTINLDVSVKGICAEAEIIEKDIERLETSFRKIETVVEESFKSEVKNFITSFKGLTHTLSSDSKIIQSLIVNLLKHYGESLTIDFDQWFQDLIKFIARINNATTRIESRSVIAKSNTKSYKNQNQIKDVPSALKMTESKAKSLPANVSAVNIFPQSFAIATTDEVSNNNQYPTRTGYLHFKKHKGKWDRRFFELTESGYLQYSKKEMSKSSHNIYMRGTNITFDSTEQTIIIEYGNEILKIKAENDLDALDWFSDLKFYSQQNS